jgi:putative hemolysin
MLPIILFVFLAACVIGSGLLSATETAMFSLPQFKLRSFAKDNDIKKRLVATLLTQPRQLLITILMLNISMNILVQNITSSIFEDNSGWFYTVVVPLLMTLTVGELIPKALAISYNVKIAPLFAPLLYFTQWLIRPARVAISWVTDHISSVLFFYLKKEKEVSVDEIKHALKASRDFGVLSVEEAKLLRGYLSLDEMIVKEIMNPRSDILYYDINDPIENLISLFVDKECSRIPVVEGDKENIIGIIESQAVFLSREEIKVSQDIRRFLQKPFFIPESMPAKLLFNQFNTTKGRLAIVVDEYGSISGLITLEDLIEIVVGQIEDRRDDAAYTLSGQDVMIARGKLELSEFEEIFDVPLESKCNMATLGGWLTEQMGDIPHLGAKYMTKDFLFHILSATPSHIESVYVKRIGRKGGRKS